MTTSHDVIEVGARKVGASPRTGRILEVLGPSEHPHYRVEWDDGHESIFYPAGDTRILAAGAEAQRPSS